MKVLFVSSGNSGDVGVIVRNQAESLIKQGIEIDFFLIRGKGFKGYWRSIKGIRNTYLTGGYDLIHAHYSLSAFAASLSGRFPLVVSLMGSDTYLSGISRLLVRIFCYLSWDLTIVKTERMRLLLKIKKLIVLPNGVDTERFRVIQKEVAKRKIGYNSSKKLVVFMADPNREEKNYALAKSALDFLKEEDVELMAVYNKPTEIIPYYLNAANVLLLTSKWEGSVNVVKEAMACNLPVVSTDVGDVKENLNEVEGCFICDNTPADVAAKLIQAISNHEQSNGRNKIFELNLDAKSVSNRLISLYNYVKSKQ